MLIFYCQSFSPLRSIGSYWQGSLLLLLKSKIAAIVFTMRILCNCLQKLSLLYRLIYCSADSLIEPKFFFSVSKEIKIVPPNWRKVREV